MWHACRRLLTWSSVTLHLMSLLNSGLVTRSLWCIRSLTRLVSLLQNAKLRVDDRSRRSFNDFWNRWLGEKPKAVALPCGGQNIYKACVHEVSTRLTYHEALKPGQHSWGMIENWTVFTCNAFAGFAESYGGTRLDLRSCSSPGVVCFATFWNKALALAWSRLVTLKTRKCDCGVSELTKN